MQVLTLTNNLSSRSFASSYIYIAPFCLTSSVLSTHLIFNLPFQQTLTTNTSAMASDKLVNGEKPHSVTIDVSTRQISPHGIHAYLTIQHLFEYPLLSQSFDFYQKQSLGARSLDLANNIYQRTSPYFATPASYIAPYASKLDGLGDSSLATVDKYVPAVKQTDFGTLHSYATAPFSYVFNTYHDEYTKTSRRDGEGIVSTGKAFISTELRIASESLQYVADFLGPKKDQASDKLQQLKGAGQEKAQQAKEQGLQAKDQAKEQGQQAKKQGLQKKDELANGTN